MPPGDDRLYELLSGYLDGSLDEQERVDAESALADPVARQLLEKLRQNRTEVAEIAKFAPGLPDDFTSRVMTAIEAATITEAVAPAGDRADPTRSRSTSVRWLAGIAVCAAAILCIVMVRPSAENPSGQVASGTSNSATDGTELGEITGTSPSDTTPRSNDPAPTISDEPEIQYVSDLEWHMSMTLVLHVAPTQQAQEAGVLQSLLSDAGIQSAAPIIADQELQSLLLDSEMIVTDESIAQSALYYVRAKATAVDAALQRVWSDQANFPNAYFNLSIDGPESSLMQQIAHSTGKRFTVSQSFAAPVGRLDNGEPRIEFPALKSQQVLVAKQGRSGMLMSGASMGTGSDEMADLLILVKLP